MSPHRFQRRASSPPPPGTSQDPSGGGGVSWATGAGREHQHETCTSHTQPFSQIVAPLLHLTLVLVTAVCQSSLGPHAQSVGAVAIHSPYLTTLRLPITSPFLEGPYQTHLSGVVHYAHTCPSREAQIRYETSTLLGISIVMALSCA